MGNTFPERLRYLRESKRPVRSMKVTSELCGLHPDAIRRYERGEAKPDAEALEAIAEYYEVSMDYLWRGNLPNYSQKWSGLQKE